MSLWHISLVQEEWSGSSRSSSSLCFQVVVFLQNLSLFNMTAWTYHSSDYYSLHPVFLQHSEDGIGKKTQNNLYFFIYIKKLLCYHIEIFGLVFLYCQCRTHRTEQLTAHFTFAIYPGSYQQITYTLSCQQFFRNDIVTSTFLIKK